MQLSTTLPRVVAISIATVFVVTTIGIVLFFWTCSGCEPSLRSWLSALFVSSGIVLAASGWIVGVVGFVRMVKNLFIMAAHVNESFRSANWTYRINRFNLIYAPRYLTEKGLLSRKGVFKGFVMFLLGVSMCVPLILMMGFVS